MNAVNDKQLLLEKYKRNQNYINQLIKYKILCELAGIGGLTNPSDAKEQFDTAIPLLEHGGSLVTNILQSSDSCGQGAGAMTNLLIGDKDPLFPPNAGVVLTGTEKNDEQREDAYKKGGFSAFKSDDMKQWATLEGIENLPAVIRFDVDHKHGSNNHWRTTHSYVFVATRRDEQGEVFGRLVQCYNGSLTQARDLSTGVGSKEISLREHLELVKQFDSESKLDAEKAYKAAYGVPTIIPKEDKLKVYMKAHPFDVDLAYKRLLDESNRVRQNVQWLCKVAGVPHDLKELRERKKDKIWKPIVNFSRVVMTASINYSQLTAEQRQFGDPPVAKIDFTELSAHPKSFGVTPMKPDYIKQHRLKDYGNAEIKEFAHSYQNFKEIYKNRRGWRAILGIQRRSRSEQVDKISDKLIELEKVPTEEKLVEFKKLLDDIEKQLALEKALSSYKAGESALESLCKVMNKKIDAIEEKVVIRP